MLKSTFKQADRLYKSGKQKNIKFEENIGFILKYDESISRNRFVLSLSNNYSFLNLSDFYLAHTQKVLFDDKNDMLSDVLFSVFLLVSSFDLDQALDRYKYNLIKNIYFGNLDIENCYSIILNFHPVDEETKNLFSFKRNLNNDLEVYYKDEIIDYEGLVIDYLDTLELKENQLLLDNLKEFTIQFLNILFLNKKKSIPSKIKEIKTYSIDQIISKVCKNKIDIKQLYKFDEKLYFQVFQSCLKYIRFDDNLNFDSSFFQNEESNEKIISYKKKYQSEYFLETSLILFFNNEKEIKAFKLNLNEDDKVFSQLIKFKQQSYINR